MKIRAFLAVTFVSAGTLTMLHVQLGLSTLWSSPLTRHNGSEQGTTSLAPYVPDPGKSVGSLVGKEGLNGHPNTTNTPRAECHRPEAVYGKGLDGHGSSVKPNQSHPMQRKINLLKKVRQPRHKFVWNVSEESRDPKEVHHLVFIKVHKAASTTLYNVFVRFSASRQLNVLFPAYRFNILSLYSTRMRPLLPHPASPPFLFDVLVNHVVFNYRQICPFFPSDTRYVAIVRHPWKHVQSSYAYFTNVEPRSYLMRTKSFDRYIRNQSNYERLHPRQSFTNNRMSIDLGLSPEQVTNSSHIAPFLRHLDRVLDFVLVVERLDESLVLMKRAFRWTFKDIVYMNLNSHSHNHTTSVSPDTQLMRRFRQFEQFDVALYEHYVDILDSKVAMQSSDFHQEVEAFVNINNNVRRFCVEKSPVSALEVPPSQWSGGFQVVRAECAILRARELPVNEWAQFSQMARLAPLVHN